ncbi:hypothetical protein OSTOST_13418 [Ostertagia ostertagi]
MYICRFCGAGREQSACRRTQSKEILLLMLTAMMEKGKISVSNARSLYYEGIRLRQRICKIHFNEGASYIGELVGRICRTAVQDLFTVPSYVMEEAIAHFEPYIRDIDADFKLTAYHVAAFHRDFSLAEVTIGSQTEKESFHACLPESLKLEKTDPQLLEEHFLVKGSQLLKLFRFCPSCGSKIADSECVSLTASGKAPIVHYICTECSPFEKRFEGQEDDAPQPNEIGFNGDVKIATASELMDSLCENPQPLAEEAVIDISPNASPLFGLNQLKADEEIESTSGKRINRDSGLHPRRTDTQS